MREPARERRPVLHTRHPRTESERCRSSPVCRADVGQRLRSSGLGVLSVMIGRAGTIVKAGAEVVLRRPDDPALGEGVGSLNGHEVLGHVAGTMRRYRIRILPGDRVRVEVSPCDLNRGRMVYRDR